VQPVQGQAFKKLLNGTQWAVAPPALFSLGPGQKVQKSMLINVLGVQGAAQSRGDVVRNSALPFQSRQQPAHHRRVTRSRHGPTASRRTSCNMTLSAAMEAATGATSHSRPMAASGVRWWRCGR